MSPRASIVSPRDRTVFIRHEESGATHAFKGKKLAKLLRELKAGRGQPELTSLVANGYSETLGGLDISSLTFEALDSESRGSFEHVKKD